MNSHSYAYDPAGQPTRQTRLAGDFVNYTYDNIGQLKTALGHESGGTISRAQEQLGCAYDPAGNLNYRTNNALLETLGLNGVNELTTALASGTLTVAGATAGLATNVTVSGTSLTSAPAIRYADGSWARTNVALPGGNATYTATAQDAYGRQDTNSVAVYLPSSTAYTYDLNGNLLGDGLRSFAYDDENQLVSLWVTNAWRSDFVYDGKMRRRQRIEYLWIGGAWVTNAVARYVYDGYVVIQERNSRNLPAVTYTRGRDLSGTLHQAGGIGGLLARTDHAALLTRPSAAHAYYHADVNGNITCLINTNQVVVGHYLYDPFGNILAQSGSIADANLYRFSSKEIHPNSGLICYLYRFYDPALQRWINRDLIEEFGGINLYGFVGNRPTLRQDASGLDSLDVPSVACSNLKNRVNELATEITGYISQGIMPPAATMTLFALLDDTYEKLCKNPPSPPPPAPDPIVCPVPGPISREPQPIAPPRPPPFSIPPYNPVFSPVNSIPITPGIPAPSQGTIIVIGIIVIIGGIVVTIPKPGLP